MSIPVGLWNLGENMDAHENLLKVIAGIECCFRDECGICPYEDGEFGACRCMFVLLRDALEILREVEQDGLY